MDIKEFLCIQELKKEYMDQYKSTIQRGSYEYYLYHNKENEDTILWSIIVSPILFLLASSFTAGIVILIGVWIFCIICCKIRNKSMNIDADIIYKRDICFREYLQRNHLI